MSASDNLSMAMGTLLMGELGAGERAAVRRCAVVNSFDQRLYESVLRGSTGPDLATLVTEGCVEPQRGGWGTYGVPRPIRRAAWASWWTEAGLSPDDPEVPARLREVAGEVAGWSGAPTEEALRALTLAEPERAADLFERAFAERDAALNFPGCQDLLDVLAEPERIHLLGPRLTTLRNDRDRYLKARMFWHPSLVATARYLSRPEIEQRLVDLVEGRGPRVLRMHASGGMGKSTALHWFISRRCVPEPWRVPCALVDFEQVDTAAALLRPWLLVVECAAQLNLQMDGAPFQELLREYGFYRSVLVASTGDAVPSGASTAAGTALHDDAAEVLRRFRSAMPKTPVLIAFDTIEEATLDLASADGLVSMLADLLDATPAVRVVLAGRGTAAMSRLPTLSRLPSLSRLFPADSPASELEIREFDEEQSREYLHRIRGLTDPATVDAIARRAGGLPWLLGMYADVALYRTALDPATVVEFDPDLAWCIDRVVGRLDNALQWLVRYGVVPRRLSRDFTEQVLAPRLAAGMGGTPDDRPETDRRPPHPKPLFRTVQPPPEPEQFAAAWDKLVRYAAESSWVGTDNDRINVGFHPSLLRPMRRMLAAQPVSRLLHADAVRYYARRALRAQPDDTTDLREELYHRFQLDPVDWASRLDHVLRGRSTGQDLEGVLAIADDVLSADYVGDDEPVVESGQPKVDAAALVRAQTERAWALAGLARRHQNPPGHPRWTDTDRAVGKAHGTATAHGLPYRSPHWLIARAGCLMTGGEYARALAELEPDLAVLPAETPPSDRADLLLLHAEALVAANRHPEAWQAVNEALDAARHGCLAATLVGIVTLLARLVGEVGDIGWAREAVEAIVAGLSDAWARERLRPLRAALALTAGDPAAALAIAEPADGDPASPLTDVRVEALLALCRPQEALNVLADALARVNVRAAADRYARLLTLRAWCSMALLDRDAAFADLDTAHEVWLSLRAHEAAGAVALEKAAVVLDTVGDLRTAEQYLNEFDRLGLEPSAATLPALARRAMVAAQLNTARGRHEAAAADCRAALDTLARLHADIRLTAQVAVRGLAAPSDDTETLGQYLVGLLDRVKPPGARLMLLIDLHRCPRPLAVADELIRLALPDDPPQPSGADACCALWAAELYRLAAQPKRASELALAASRELSTADPYAWWAWARFAERAGRFDLDVGVVPDQLPGYPDRPLLRGAYALLTALRRAPAEASQTTLARLEQAQPLLRGNNHWAARAHLAQAAILTRLGNLAQARLHRYAAREIFAELGDPREDAPELVEVSASAPTTPGQGELELRVDIAQGEQLAVLIDGSRALTVLADQVVGPIERQPDLAALVDHLRGTRTSRVAAALGELVAGQTPGTLVRLVTDPALVALPWEDLVRWPAEIAAVYRTPPAKIPEKARVRLLQCTLRLLRHYPGPIDGRYGPHTERALGDFQHATGLAVDRLAGPATWHALRTAVDGRTAGPLRAIIVERGARDSLRSARGHQSAGTDMTRSFARHGWTSQSTERLPTTANSPVDVLYLSGSMEASGSVPYLSLQADTYGYESAWSTPSQAESITVTALDRFLRDAATDRYAPLVVLDTSLPAIDSEAVRQVLLRNDFAHQLLALGHTPTMIATGTSSSAYDSQQFDPVDAIAAAAQSQATAVEIVRQLRATQPPFASTALFSAVRPDLLPLLLPRVAG